MKNKDSCFEKWWDEVLPYYQHKGTAKLAWNAALDKVLQNEEISDERLVAVVNKLYEDL